MSIQLLIFSVLNAAVLLATGWMIRFSGKGVSFLSFYRMSVKKAMRLEFDVVSAASLLNLIALHLFIPVTGLAFFLKSDLNFLAVLAGILISMQITQRIYPAGVSGSQEESILS